MCFSLEVTIGILVTRWVKSFVIFEDVELANMEFNWDLPNNTIRIHLDNAWRDSETHNYYRYVVSYGNGGSTGLYCTHDRCRHYRDESYVLQAPATMTLLTAR